MRNLRCFLFFVSILALLYLHSHAMELSVSKLPLGGPTYFDRLPAELKDYLSVLLEKNNPSISEKCWCRHPEPIVLKGHAIHSVRLSPQGDKIVSISADKNVKICNALDGLCIAILFQIKRVCSAQFNQQGDKIVTTSDDSNVAKIWNVSNGLLMVSLEGHTDTISSAQFSPSDDKIVTASRDNTARIWKAADGICIAILDNTKMVQSAQFSPYGDKIVTTSYQYCITRIWNGSNGLHIADLDHIGGLFNSTKSAQFNPCGDKIVTTSNDNTAKIWNANNGSCIAILKGHIDRVNSAQFSLQSDKIVTASRDKSARIWNAHDGLCLVILIGHTGDVHSAQFNAKNEIVTISADATAKIWRASDGFCITTLLGHTGDVYSVQFSPCGNKVLTASYDNTARIWGKRKCTLYECIAALKAVEPLKLESFSTVKKSRANKKRVRQ